MAAEPLTDDECEELMYLYRVVRADNATAEETERLKGLMRRFYAAKDAKKPAPTEE